MTGKNLYQTPKAELLEDMTGNSPGGGTVLRMALLILFGFYVFVFSLAWLASSFAFEHGITVKHVINMAITLLILYFSIKAFKCIKLRNSHAYLYTLALFGVGSVGTSIYRLLYITPHLSKADVGNFILFGIPVVFTYVYWTRIKTPGKGSIILLASLVPVLIVFTCSGLLIFNTYRNYLQSAQQPHLSKSLSSSRHTPHVQASQYPGVTKSLSTPSPVGTHQANSTVTSKKSACPIQYLT